MKDKQIYWSALSVAGPGLRKKLQVMIQEGHEHFLLSGTDPDIPGGCCPSTEVGEAHRLVEAGILCVQEIPMAPGMCPSRIYCFPGEMPEQEGAPFRINSWFREELQSQFRKQKQLAVLKVVCRWLLLGFIFLSVAYAVISRLSEKPHPSSSGQRLSIEDFHFPKETRILKEDFTLVLLFHYKMRCDFCLSIEELSRECLDRDFGQELAEGTILFSSIIIDDPANEWLINRWDIFTSSLVLVRFVSDQERGWVLVEEAWRLKGEEFLEMLTQRIRAFEEGDNLLW